MSKDYQRPEIDWVGSAVPGQVSVAIGEIAADVREGLLALAVGAGLQLMYAMMEADVTALAGAHGVPVCTVETAGDFDQALHGEGGGVRIVVGRTDRTANVAVHDELFGAVAAAATA